MKGNQFDFSGLCFDDLCYLIDKATFVMREKYNVQNGEGSFFEKSSNSETTKLADGAQVTISIINDSKKDEDFMFLEGLTVEDLAEIIALAANQLPRAYGG